MPARAKHATLDAKWIRNWINHDEMYSLLKQVPYEYGVPRNRTKTLHHNHPPEPHNPQRIKNKPWKLNAPHPPPLTAS